MTLRHSTTGWLLLGLVALGSTAAAQTSLTIYQDGRVLARRSIAVPVPAGRSIQRLSLGALDLGSLFSLDSGVVLGSATYDAALDEASAMRRLVGRTIKFQVRPAMGPVESVEAVVLGADPERFRLTDGSIVFQRPGQPLFPSDVVTADPTVTVALESDKARPSLGVGYFTTGGSWQASYSILLGRPGARVTGQAVITTGQLRFDSAQVQLLAGTIRRATFAKAGDMIAARAAPMAAEAAAESQVGEAHLYTLPNPIRLEPGVETATPLFPPARTGYERVYTLRGQIPLYGDLAQNGEESREPVAVTYVIKRASRTDFGDRPLPGGVARVYQADAGGRAQLVGEAGFSHTAAGQDLRLEAGTAFDLTARRVQTEYTTERTRTQTIAMATYTVTIANAKDTSATVDVLEQRAGEWSIVSSSIPPEKLSSTITRFRVAVPAKGEAKLTYRVRVTW